MGKKIKYINNNEYVINQLNTQIQYSKGSIITIACADLHFGVFNPKTQYEILSEQLLDKVKNVPFDIFTINGDLFDHKFMSNSDAVMYCCMFIDKVVRLCKEKNATLFLIAGTNSHDANQLSLFYHYLEDPEIDIRIVEECRFEYTKNATILCIPEEYGKGEEYYKSILMSRKYDMIFMHGNYKGAFYDPNAQGLDSDRNPTFNLDDFCMCKGPMLSGHIHIPKCLDKYFYYCGSPYRFSFGEEEAKGFLINLQNLDTSEHYIHFEEIKSFRYDTINLDYMLNDDPKNVIQYVSKLKDEGVDYVRLEFNNVNDNNISNFNIINNYYKSSNTVKIKTSYSEKQKVLDTNEETLKSYSEYEYILDPQLSPQEIFCKYVNQQKGFEYISVDKLMEILNDF